MLKMLYKLGGWVVYYCIKVICVWIVVLVVLIGFVIMLKLSFFEDMFIFDIFLEKVMDVI